MSFNKRKFDFHVLTYIILFLSLIIIIFSNDNPAVVFSLYFYIFSLFIYSGNTYKLKKVLVCFIPFAIFIILLNMIFVTQGSMILFQIGSKKFTLEALIYALTMALKLFAVASLFISFEFIIDSDRAISYFSSKMPKSTLTLVIAFKLVPGLRDRLNKLKEIYTIRGVDFNKKSSREKTKSYVPVLSILLENSMESSFDIGEAAFVRGFLSNERSTYDRQKFRKKDISIMVLSGVLLIVYIFAQYKGAVDFKIYDGVSLVNIFNYGTTSIFVIILAITLLILKYSREKDYGIYRD